MTGHPKDLRWARRPRATVPVLLLAGSLCLAPAVAQASGLDAPMVGSSQSGPAIADAGAVFWNPAQLAFIQRKSLQLGLGLVSGRVGYQRVRQGQYQTPDTFQFKTPLDPDNVDPGKTGPAGEVTATPFSPVGDAFVAIPVVPDRVVIGAGVYVPYAAALKFPEEGAQAWQLRQALIAASFVTASAGVQLTQRLSVGAGLSYVGGVAELSKLQDFGSLEEFQRAFSGDPINQPNDFGPNAPSEVRELEVLSRSIAIKNGLSNGFSFNLGVAFRPTDSLSLGLSYQHSAPMRYVGKFAIDMNDAFFTQDLAAQGLQYKPLVEGDATLSFSLPKRLSLGAAYDVSTSLRVDGFIQYVKYSDIDAFLVRTQSPDLAQPRLGLGDEVLVRLPRNWNNTLWVEGSARYRLSSSLLGSVTVGYQSPASPDSTIDVASPDGHRLIGGLGAVYSFSESVALSADVRLQGILPRTVTTSDHDLGNGRYTLFIAAAGGHLRVMF
jgi:long-chain fatty acid transport protein